ncbi:hypothetical protein AB4059_12865 [Lysobacter sp. 2RAF19]
MSTTVEHHYWAGVAEVIPMSGNHLLEGADGAYVGVVGVAQSEKEFIANAKAALSAMEFDMLELTERELIPTVERWINADDSLREKLSTLSAQNPIEFGVFHSFKG